MNALRSKAPSSASSSPASSQDMAGVFAALSNPVRIEIVKHIAHHQQCGCKEITQVLPLAQSTVSQHLKVLIAAGIVIVKTVPPRSHYQLNDKLLSELSSTMCSFLESCCQSKTT